MATTQIVVHDKEGNREVASVVPWTLDEARILCAKLESLVSGCGFLLSIYGSTVRKGIGRDLDIILVQKRCGASAEFVCDAIFRELLAERIVGPEEGLFCDRTELLRLPDGKLLDIQVRMTPIRDAYDLYLKRGRI